MSSYVLAGYLVTFVVLGSYTLSLLRRQRVVRRRLVDPLGSDGPLSAQRDPSPTASGVGPDRER